MPTVSPTPGDSFDMPIAGAYYKWNNQFPVPDDDPQWKSEIPGMIRIGHVAGAKRDEKGQLNLIMLMGHWDGKTTDEKILKMDQRSIMVPYDSFKSWTKIDSLRPSARMF